MERLSLHDNPGGSHQVPNPQQEPPPQNAAGQPTTQGGPPQLPPQMFTTAAQLLDLTDKKLVLVLRDGRKLIGVLRSWDQFANLVLQDTVERLYVDKLYADIPRGLFLVRGENVLLLGEIDLDKEDDVPAFLTKATPDEVFELKKKEDSSRKSREKKQNRKLEDLGFEPEHSGEILF